MNGLLVLTLCALDWIAAEGLATPAKRRAWWSDDEFDALLTTPWIPEAMKHPKYAQRGLAPHEALRLVREGAREVGRELGIAGVPDHHYDNSLGDGTVGGMKAMAAKNFHEVAPHGMMANIMYGLDLVGNPHRTVDIETAIGEYGMVAERASASPRVSQLMQLLLSQQWPDTTKIFGLVHDLLASFNAPRETLSFIQQVGHMFSGGSPPSLDQLRHLQNTTWTRLRNLTRGAAPSGQYPVHQFRGFDHWKATSNNLHILFKLPCITGSPVCFYLAHETYVRKKGPGVWDGEFKYGPKGVLSNALSIAFQTPASLISLPFYNSPQPASGTEFDIQLAGAQKDFFFNPETVITASLGMTDTSACSGYGVIPLGRYEMCAIPAIGIGGGFPKLSFKLKLRPTRARDIDSSMLLYAPLRFDAAIGEALQRTFMPDSTYVGFYRVFPNPAKPIYPMSVASDFF